MRLKAIVTGSNGFIGKHLVSRLGADGVDILPIERKMFKAPNLLRDIVIAFQPALIFHLSAYGNLIHQTDDIETIQANITNLFNLLLASRDVEYTNFINFSTSSVMLPTKTMYSATKASGEEICKAFASKYQKPITSIRPFTVIGRGEHQEHLIPTLIRSCMLGEKMRFVADPTHDFIGIDDFIDAIRAIIQNYYTSGKIIDIGTGIKTTNQEVLELVEKVTQKKANIIPVKSMRAYDNNNWVANPAIIQSLGWKQKQSLETVIADMVYGFN